MTTFLTAHAHDFDNIIFDLGDVLFTWSPAAETPIPPKTLQQILKTVIWFEYEKGVISEAECYAAVAREMGLHPEQVRRAFEGARGTLVVRSSMVELIRELKRGRKVYAMSNISAPDWEVVRGRLSDWDLFDHVFTSASAKERKPNIGFYRHVLEQTGADPTRTIFVDDKVDNILTARSFGITGVVYDHFKNVERTLRNLCGDPVERARAFMRANAQHHTTFTSDGHPIEEIFSQLLILEATGDPSLVEDIPEFDGPINFFRGKGQFTTSEYPCDVDTTSIGFNTSTVASAHTKNRIMDEILKLRDSDNILPVYFDASRPRLDPVVCINALTFFYANGRGHELQESFDWVEAVLIHRAYVDGTRYYETAEAFLFFLSRLLAVSPYARHRLQSVFEERCRERIGMEGDALALAMRIICCSTVGIDLPLERARLLELQQVDGGWDEGWFYKYGSQGVRIANRGVTTAFAIKAIETLAGRKLDSGEH